MSLYKPCACDRPDLREMEDFGKPDNLRRRAVETRVERIERMRRAQHSRAPILILYLAVAVVLEAAALVWFIW